MEFKDSYIKLKHDHITTGYKYVDKENKNDPEEIPDIDKYMEFRWKILFLVTCVLMAILIFYV